MYLGRLLRAGGIVFVDDYQLPAVQRAVSFCVTNLGWTLEEVSAADDLHQWAVLRTSEVPDTRPFDYYVDFSCLHQGLRQLLGVPRCNPPVLSGCIRSTRLGHAGLTGIQVRHLMPIFYYECPRCSLEMEATKE